MAKLVLNAGSANNDKTGDTLRAGALKIKANFEEIYAALANDGMNISGGNVLKTGDYQDLRNKPEFAVVATSGDFYDLSARPDIGIFVGVPGNSTGSEGHVAGNLAFDGNNLYVCREDYVETEEFGSFNFLRADGDVAYSLQARFANTGSEIAFTQNESLAPIAPEVDWTVTDGTTTRTITAVSQELDGSTVYYLCTLDGAFTSTVGTHYTLSFPLASGQYAFYSTWNVAYQNLIDAHAIGKPIHLHVTYDGYGRLINHVARNSITNEIVITYTAGSEIADYEGLTVKIDQPSIWKSIPWAPYGNGFSGVDLGSFKISGNILGTEGSTEETWGASGIGIDPGGESNAGIWIPRVADQTSGGDLDVYNNGTGGGSIRLMTDNGTWQFKNDGSLQLPLNGTITNSSGQVLVSSTTFVDLPTWLTAVSGTNHLPTINADYGWDSNGVWFTNNTIHGAEGEGTSYPVRLADSIPASYGVVITVDFDADPFSNDFGIGVWESGTDPVWAWGASPGGNRIGAQYNGTTPELYGIVGTGVVSEGRWDLPSAGTYKARLTISPPSGGSITVTLETLDTDYNVLDTISYEEQAFSSSYTIGFAADQDNGTDKTYMKNLIVNINDGATIYNDTLTAYNSNGSTGTGHFNFADNTVTVTSQDMNFVTTRNGFDIDCDFDVEAADDIWIRALGDQIGVTAANSIYFESNNLDMYPNTFYGEESDFLGTWTGNELTISTVNGNTNLINLLTEYVSNPRSIWIKTSAGYVETTNNDPALKTVGDTNTVFVIPTTATSPSSGIAVLRLKLYDSINSDRTSWYWEFRKDGTTTIPGKIDFPIKTVDLHNGGQQQGSTLQFTNPDYQAIITGPTPTANNNAQRLIIQGQRGLGTGEGGDVYLWAGDAEGTNAGDIKIYAGDADQTDAGTGGYINIDAGRGFNNGGNVSITGGDSPGGTGGNVSIMSGNGVTSADNGSVSIQVGGYYWQFNNTGSLVIPSGSDIKNSSGNSVINNGVASPTPTGDPVYPTAIDLTKTINALADNAGSWYTLANGYEGQIMYLVPKNGTTNINTTINIANARVLDNSGSTTASVYTNIDFRPFSTINGDVPNVVTMIFTDGAWQSSGGTWD